MQMTDMRLSAMTAGLTEALLDAMQCQHDDGRIIVGESAEDAPDSSWSQRTMAPFEVIPIELAEDWTLRISPRVLEQMR